MPSSFFLDIGTHCGWHHILAGTDRAEEFETSNFGNHPRKMLDGVPHIRGLVWQMMTKSSGLFNASLT